MSKVLSILLLLSVACSVVFAWRLSEEKSRVVDAAFRADSIQAAADSQIKIVIGERDFYAKRAIQTKLERDSISKLLQSEKVVVTRLTGHIAKLDDSLRVVSTSIDSTEKLFEFERYNEPYKLNASIAVKKDTADIKYSILTDPINLGLSVECGRAGVGGVRSASIAVDAPRFFTVGIDSVRQDKTVCNSEVLNPSHFKSKLFYIGVGAGALYIAAKMANELFKKR